MVNPESRAYRAHPDDVLHAAGAPRPGMRQQLIWDLGDESVRTRLLAQLDALLSAHPIKALKWDCNRDAFPAARHGRPRRIAQTEGVYALMQAVRAAHPAVEIEACASGGARLDLGIAAFTARVWPSDCTDPVERLRIMRWASLIFPLERLGSHVGPSPNPITTRSAPMDFRAKIALLGHMGVELDPRRLSDADKTTLSAHIALYKGHRALLHTGRLVQWEAPNGAQARIVVRSDQREALVLLAQTQMGMDAPCPLPGLEDELSYRVCALAPWPVKAQRRLAPDSPWHDGFIATGQTLRTQGLHLPMIDPLTAWLVHLQAD
jgi:alpha-galactosidase